MADKQQPYGYRTLHLAPHGLADSLTWREIERAQKQRETQRRMQSFNVGVSTVAKL